MQMASSKMKRDQAGNEGKEQEKDAREKLNEF